MLAVAASGCSQSLFDSNVGDDDVAIDARIGGPDADVNQPDADVNQPDADVNMPDADINMPDGGGGTPCNLTAGCLGDLVEEWDDVQGGTLGRFRYLDDSRALYDAYSEMVYGTWNAVMAWLGAGTTPEPAIVNCTLFAADGVCAGLDDRLLLSPSNSGAGRRDAVVEWTAPLAGTIHLAGDYRTADGATGMPQKIMVSRNTRHDLLFKDTFLPSALPAILDTDIDVLAGDKILLAAAPPTSGTSVPLGFKLRYLDGDAFPGACQAAISMEAGALVDVCTGAPVDEWQYDGSLTMVPTISIPSFSTIFGTARQVVEDHFLELTGGAMDYSGDFTIQFWLKNDQASGGDSTTETVHGDWDCDLERGLAIGFYSPGDIIWVSYFKTDPSADYCGYIDPMNPTPPLGFSAVFPSDDAWHFYRITRSTTDGNLRLCIDGQQRGQTTVAAAEDLTSGVPVKIGRTFGWPYFSASVDDYRVYKRALPCPTP